MRETFRLAKNFGTSFSGNTSFHGVSEVYPLTPVTANVLNARDFFHHWGSKIKKLASRRTYSVSLQHRDRGFDSFSGHGCISMWCCDVQEVKPNVQWFISQLQVMRIEWVLSLIKQCGHRTLLYKHPVSMTTLHTSRCLWTQSPRYNTFYLAYY
jgi:hypothetical protein